MGKILGVEIVRIQYPVNERTSGIMTRRNLEVTLYKELRMLICQLPAINPSMDTEEIRWRHVIRA